MKSLRHVLFFLIIASTVMAQNWSTPVPVTSGAGDDHHIAVGYLNYQGLLLLAWDRTENSNTDVYARTMNLQYGVLSEEIRVTSGPAIEENPTVLEGVEGDNGLFFQGNASGIFKIYYSHYINPGFSLPYTAFYSDHDLHDPVATTFGEIAHPWVFCHSDSTPVSMNCTIMQGIPDSSFCPDSGHSQVDDVTGYGMFWMGSWEEFIRWAWAVQINGQWEIRYAYNGFGSPSEPVGYSGLIPNNGYNYRRPVQSNLTLYLDRESGQDTEIVRTEMNPDSGIWSVPVPAFPNQGNSRNLHLLEDNLIFESDWNGNWDIGFWHPEFFEFIDTNPAEDRNPIITMDNGTHLYAFWESNRDGTWKIFSSYRNILGVQEHQKVILPQHVNLSVAPNPSNAQFRISLDLPQSGWGRVSVWDLAGRKVADLFNGTMTAGHHSMTWEARAQSSGIYLLKVENRDHVQCQKLALLK